MIIQIQATEQYFPVVIFIMLYKVVLTFEPSVAIQIKVNEQCLLKVLLVAEYKVGVTIKSVDHSNERL